MKLSSAHWIALTVSLLVRTAAWALPGFATFESGQVRPLALTPDGSRLLAVNTPDNQLEIFSVNGGDLSHTESLAVGMEPVAVALRNDSEAWVVNHLSDSISIVDLSSSPARVVRTLLVGDEPRDIVFAGPSRDRAFITTAHRGQQRGDASLSGVPGAGDPQLTTSGIGRADVWVFDAANLGSTIGGSPLTIVTLFGDTPRALAVDPSGNFVYAAIFNSGNQTTTIPEGAVCDGGASASTCNVVGVTMPGGLPAPNTNAAGIAQPEVGLIVKYNNSLSRWQDELGRNWNNAVQFSLPDLDLFKINASANPPVQVASYAGVGTTLFNLAVNPSNGRVYVTNTNARNEVRFEGPGVFAGHTVRGHLHEARISVLSGATVTARHLNKHINYAVVPSAPGVSDASLATPMGMAINATGSTLYVAGFGSSQIGVYDTATLEDNSFDPTMVPHIQLSGGGPTGLALDETNQRLYALTRFDNSVTIIDTATKTEIAKKTLHNPEPYRVVKGRPFLYDAHSTSSNGEASCSSCHIFGDMDHLAWDLGNPDDVATPNPNPLEVTQLPSPAVQSFPGFHPMKGPMTTQSLRGLANNGPMHWRGDRTGGSNPGGDPLDESAAFNKFNVAFEGLLGRASALTSDEMQSFTNFALEITYPPNPVRALDNSLTADQAAGRDFYIDSAPSDGVRTCNGCHRLNPALGQFGTNAKMSYDNEPQFMKIPHLRNLYTKIGMFGMNAVSFFNPGDNGYKGPQIRGFGLMHDGSVDTPFRFLQATAFNQFQFGLPLNSGGFDTGPSGVTQRRQVEQFLLAFDTDLAPIVGQQVTLDATNSTVAGARIDLMIARAAAGECDLTVKGAIAGEPHGWYRRDDGDFQGDRATDAPIGDFDLRSFATTAGQELTYTCVNPGAGRRIGTDRDGDLVPDGDERDAGTDPGDPRSTPSDIVLCDGGVEITEPRFDLKGMLTAPGDERIGFKAKLMSSREPPIDPVARGFSFSVLNNTGQILFARQVPAGAAVDGVGWKASGNGKKWSYKDSSGTAANGVRSIKIADESAKVPGQYSIKLKGKNGAFPISPSDLPIQLVLVLGDGEQVANQQCGTVTLEVPGQPAPACEIRSGGDGLSCR